MKFCPCKELSNIAHLSPNHPKQCQENGLSGDLVSPNPTFACFFLPFDRMIKDNLMGLYLYKHGTIESHDMSRE